MDYGNVEMIECEEINYTTKSPLSLTVTALFVISSQVSAVSSVVIVSPLLCISLFVFIIYIQYVTYCSFKVVAERQKKAPSSY